MAVPGHRRTSSDKRRRAAHFALKKRVFATCAKCKEPVLPHHACQNCGTYSGRKAVDTSRSLARAVKKAQTALPPVKENEQSAKAAEAKKENKEKKPSEKKSAKE